MYHLVSETFNALLFVQSLLYFLSNTIYDSYLLRGENIAAGVKRKIERS